MGRWEAESLRCWDKTKGMSNWKFCNRDPLALSPPAPCREQRALETKEDVLESHVSEREVK